MRKLLTITLAAMIISGCAEPDNGVHSVRITPAINTRVTGLHFDTGDCIGLTMTRGGEIYAENVAMTYDGATFSSGLMWYGDRQDESTLTAYYPYCAAGTPREFAVEADQREGVEASDLLIAVKPNVTPASAPVGMLFQHVMSRLTIIVANNSDATVSGIKVGGFIPTAEVDYASPAATVKSGAASADISALEVTADACYRVVLVPQTAALTVTASMSDGKTHTKTISSAQLEGGKRYDVSVAVSNEGIEIVLSGEIGDWQDGGSLGGDDDTQTLVYGGATYLTANIGGRVWMAENLRYVPDAALIRNGIWYPVKGSSASTDPEYVRQKGMLYSFTVATGINISGANTQGICPDGWHVPSMDELQQLIASPEYDDDFLCCAGMWIPSSSQYTAETKGYLMSATTDDGGLTYSALSYTTAGGNLGTRQWEAGYGVSVRCVKNL
ncbi:fimbrillin family protein [uncultured Alistipes sp.]|uniref:fimbrillin family protein n=1 Tax=uncultured Alistipes sp. TaxID=538949 RepID=UPI0025F60CB2|nr:fimbrillin family protein [uncultured Alistipes sp.]